MKSFPVRLALIPALVICIGMAMTSCAEKGYALSGKKVTHRPKVKTADCPGVNSTGTNKQKIRYKPQDGLMDKKMAKTLDKAK